MKRIPKPKKVSIDRHNALNRTERKAVHRVVNKVTETGRKITRKP